LTISHLASLAHLPEGFTEVRDISLGKNQILVQGRELASKLLFSSLLIPDF
jgi:hypothetical protein